MKEYKQKIVVQEVGEEFFRMDIDEKAEFFEDFFRANELCFEDFNEDTGRSRLMTYSELFELFEKEEVTEFEIVATLIQFDKMCLQHSIKFEGHNPIRVFKLDAA